MIEEIKPREMFILAFWVEGVPAEISLRFRDREKAMELLTAFRDAPAGTSVDMEDAFGLQITVPRSKVLVSRFIDIAGDIEAQIELKLTQERANAALQTRLQNDATLALHGSIRRPGLIGIS